MWWARRPSVSCAANPPLPFTGEGRGEGRPRPAPSSAAEQRQADLTPTLSRGRERGRPGVRGTACATLLGGALLALFAASLAGCGFEPLYGERARAFDPTLAAIYVESIPERDGQLLAISLRDSFNPGGHPVETKYRLRVTLSSSRSEVAIRQDATASRLQLVTTASWLLFPVKGGAPIGGSARSITSFDITDNEYANLVAEKDGRARLIRELGEEIRLGVRRYLTKQGAA